MNHYQKLNPPINAIQYTGDNLESEIQQQFKDLILRPGSFLKDTILIDTKLGHMPCAIGDYIIQTRAGNFYPSKKEIFEATYKKVDLL